MLLPFVNCSGRRRRVDIRIDRAHEGNHGRACGVARDLAEPSFRVKNYRVTYRKKTTRHTEATD